MQTQSELNLTMQAQTIILLAFLISTLRSFVAIFWGVFLLFHRKKSQQILALSAIFIVIGLLYLRNSFFRLPALGPVDSYAPLSYFILILIAPMTLFYVWFTLNEKKKLVHFLIHYIPLVFVSLFYLAVKLSGEAPIPQCNSIVDVIGYTDEYPLQVYFYITLIVVFLLQVFSYFSIALFKILAVMKTYRKHNLSLHTLKLLVLIDFMFLLYPLVGAVFLSFANNITIVLIHNILVTILITFIAILNLKLLLPLQTNIDFMFDDKLKIKSNYSSNPSLGLNKKDEVANPCSGTASNAIIENGVDDWEDNALLRSRIKMLMEDKEIFRLSQLTLDDLVTELNSNRSYVSEAINKHCGCNFKQLLIRYRIDAAKELLLHTELDIQTISEQAGFNSRMSFYRAFKENVSDDLSPVEWRKQNLAN